MIGVYIPTALQIKEIKKVKGKKIKTRIDDLKTNNRLRPIEGYGSQWKKKEKKNTHVNENEGKLSKVIYYATI